MSENLNDVSGDSEDISFEIDDDWPVQGGTTDPDISPIETQDPTEETGSATNVDCRSTWTGSRFYRESAAHCIKNTQTR